MVGEVRAPSPMLSRFSRVLPWLTVPLALVSILVTLSLLNENQRTSLLIVTCCMLGVVPVVLFQGYRKDLRERDETKQALEQSEERYQRFLAGVPVPLVICRKGRILQANAAFEQLVEAPAGSVVGRKFNEWMDLVTRDGGERELVEAEHRRQVRTLVDQQLVAAGGKRVAVEIAALPAEHQGEPAMQLFVRDVSDRKQARAAEAEAREQIARAESAKGEFLASVSHEIRTPMNAILGFSGLLLDTPVSEKQRGYLETVRRSADQLLSMFNDVLDMAKLEAGQLALEPAGFDLEQMLEELLQWMEPQARGKGIQVSLIYAPEVPRLVVCDAGRIRQITQHLVENAIRFTDRGRVLVAVEEERRGDDSTLLRFSVSDTGSGIPYEQQKRMFQMFSAGEVGVRRTQGGLGLGLALVRRLVEQMNGSVGVVSKPGLGSTFHFRLPLPLAGPDSRPRADAPERSVSPAIDGELFLGRRVLLVDDNASNQQLGAALLERFGARVDLAANGAEAVQMADRLPYDAIFMDCQMPEMNGYEATAEIRRREVGRRRTPIVAMTANCFHGDKERCLEAGMDDYIGKPVDVLDLRNLLLALSNANFDAPSANDRPL
ncbi:MAG: response regulator [Bryobacterales bacterium]|nr:response regulator [Bryobacterales bacterium]